MKGMEFGTRNLLTEVFDCEKIELQFHVHRFAWWLANLSLTIRSHKGKNWPPYREPSSQLVQAPSGPTMGYRTDNDVWFALRVRSNFERKTGDLLACKGFAVFSPMYVRSRRGRSGIAKSSLPLFPGYIFCSFDPYDRLPILTTPGIVHIVGIGKSPVPVDGKELANVRAMVGRGDGVCPRSYLNTGQTIRIESGPLAGVEGILEEFRSCYRVVVSITLLQRSVSAEVDAGWLQPLGQFRAALREEPPSERVASA